MNVNTQIYITYFSLPGGIIIMGRHDGNVSHSFAGIFSFLWPNYFSLIDFVLMQNFNEDLFLTRRSWFCARVEMDSNQLNYYFLDVQKFMKFTTFQKLAHHIPDKEFRVVCKGCVRIALSYDFIMKNSSSKVFLVYCFPSWPLAKA